MEVSTYFALLAISHQNEVQEKHLQLQHDKWKENAICLIPFYLLLVWKQL
jgi:hypothetical protein